MPIKLNARNSIRLLDIHRLPNPGQKPDLVLINKKIICRQVNIADPADTRMKM